MRVLAAIMISFSVLSCASEDRASSTVNDEGTAEWEQVYTCENDEVVVRRHLADQTHYQFELRNDDLNRYLNLGWHPKHEGVGAAGTFVGLKSEFAHFWENHQRAGVYRTAHVFPEFGGLKVKVDTAPHAICRYLANFGDPGGGLNSIPSKDPHSCPDQEPHYSLYDVYSQQFEQASKDWFFQNCSAVE